MADLMSITSTTMDTLWLILIVVIIISLLTLIVIMVFVILPYKHKFRIRELTGGKTCIIDTKAKEIKDKQGTTKWKLLKGGIIVKVPPQDAKHLTHKGKYSVEAYKTAEGEYKYIIDNGINAKENQNFQPLTSEDREFYAHEMREAEEYKKSKWTDYILPFAGAFSILIVLILMLVFWEDVAAPGIKIVEIAKDTQETQLQIAQQNKETTLLLREMIQDRQTIQSKTTEETTK